MNTYHHLFSPIKVGHTTIKNRVFMPPISTNLADKGYITDELIQHYEARAKGGVGLIVTEVTTVEPVSYTHLILFPPVSAPVQAFPIPQFPRHQ